MAFSDLQKFHESTYSVMGELLDYQFEKFNAASAGTIVLRSGGNNVGDVTERALYKLTSNIVKRRDPAGTGAIASKDMSHIKDVSVKVGGGSHPVNLTKAWWSWIKRSPEEAAAVFAQQLAEQRLQDYFLVGLGAGLAVLNKHTELVYDGSATTMDISKFVDGQALYGDSMNDIVCWVMHSAPLNQIYKGNLANGQQLFQYGSVNIQRDPFGRLFVITDSAPLVGATFYNVLGLTSNAIVVEDNGDFNQNITETNGKENIETTYQSEWSFQLGVKGHAWDQATAGSDAPTTSALSTAANWSQYSTSLKEGPGVLIKTKK